MASNKAFAELQGFDYPLLCDEDRSVSVAYGAAASAGAEKASRIAAVINEKGTIAAIYDPAGKGEFPAKVLADL